MDNIMPEPELFMNILTGEVVNLMPSDPRRFDRNYIQPKGQLVTAELYPELFAIIGIQYGGDEELGIFYVPDFRVTPAQ